MICAQARAWKKRCLLMTVLVVRAGNRRNSVYCWQLRTGRRCRFHKKEFPQPGLRKWGENTDRSRSIASKNHSGYGCMHLQHFVNMQQPNKQKNKQTSLVTTRVSLEIVTERPKCAHYRPARADLASLDYCKSKPNQTKHNATTIFECIHTNRIYFPILPLRLQNPLF